MAAAELMEVVRQAAQAFDQDALVGWPHRLAPRCEPATLARWKEIWPWRVLVGGKPVALIDADGCLEV